MTDTDAQRSLQELILAHSAMVYRLALARTCRKEDAEEVYQEVFLRLIEKRPAFRDETHCRAWLIRVTINCAVTLLRQRSRQAPAPAEPVCTPDSEALELQLALQKLPPHYREVLHLYYYEDLPVEQISRLLRRKSSTVRAQLSRGRAMLREELKEDCFS